MNACAESVCMATEENLFGQSQKMPRSEKERKFRNALEALLPAGELRGKTVPNYRDGSFAGTSDSTKLGAGDPIPIHFG